MLVWEMYDDWAWLLRDSGEESWLTSTTVATLTSTSYRKLSRLPGINARHAYSMSSVCCSQHTSYHKQLMTRSSKQADRKPKRTRRSGDTMYAPHELQMTMRMRGRRMRKCAGRGDGMLEASVSR